MMDLVIIIGTSLLIFSALCCLATYLYNKKHRLIKFVYKKERGGRRFGLYYCDQVYFEVILCRIARHYKIEICWGW